MSINQTKNGFSLIELLLMVALLGILGISFMTRSPSIDKTRLNAAVEQVRTHIELAKQNAELTQVTSGVTFVNGGSYTVYQNTSATPIENPLDKQNLIVTLANSFPGISISANYTVEFDKMGAPTTGGGGNVTITDGTNTKTITVTANSGKVVDL